MNETPIELLLYEYEQQVLNFYVPVFTSEDTAEEFIDAVHASCSKDKGNALQMLFQVERFVSLADNIEKIYPTRDPLRLLFIKTCLEALSYLSPEFSKSGFYDCFAECFSEKGKSHILNSFKLSGFNVKIYEIDYEESYSITISDFLKIIKAIRDKVVHDGDFWTSQIFASDNDSTWCVTLETDEKIISAHNYPKENKNIEYHFTTTLQYENFRYYFIEACVNYINQYCEKLNGEDIKC